MKLHSSLNQSETQYLLAGRDHTRLLPNTHLNILHGLINIFDIVIFSSKVRLWTLWQNKIIKKRRECIERVDWTLNTHKPLSITHICLGVWLNMIVGTSLLKLLFQKLFPLYCLSNAFSRLKNHTLNTHGTHFLLRDTY